MLRKLPTADCNSVVAISPLPVGNGKKRTAGARWALPTCAQSTLSRQPTDGPGAGNHGGRGGLPDRRAGDMDFAAPDSGQARISM